MDLLESTPKPGSQPLPPYARAFVVSVIVLGGIVVTYSLGRLLTQPVSGLFLVLLVLTAVTGLATLRVPGMPISFSISDTFTIIAALVVGPAAGAVTAALDGLVLSCQMLNDRRSVHRVLFNMAQAAVATFVSAELFLALAGSTPLADGPSGAFRLLGLLTVFGLLDFALTSGSIAVAIALERQLSILGVWKEHFGGFWLTYLGGIFAAMLMMAIGRASALETLILIAPLPVILYVTFRHAEGRARDQIKNLGQMNKVYVAAIEALAQAIDTKDQVTHDHIRRVQTNSVRLARMVGVTDPMQFEAIKAASLLHDVGKIGVPEHILNKPGRLSPSEFAIMKQHAPRGADIVSVIGFPYPVAPIVRHHHENWDGTGYPDGLSGEDIPIGARILQIVDCFDALTSDRPYRPRLDVRDALKILADRKGTMYDPHLVDAFFALQAADTQEDIAVPASEAEKGEPKEHSAAPGESGSDLMAFQAFYDLGRALPSLPSTRELGQELWQRLATHLPAAAFVLYTYESESDSLVAGFCSEAGLVGTDTRIALGARLSGWVAATGQAIVNSDARLDLDEGLPAVLRLKSALAVPVRVDRRTIAVLAFYSEQAEAFTETHRQIAEAATHVVSAVRSRPGANTSLVSAA